MQNSSSYSTTPKSQWHLLPLAGSSTLDVQQKSASLSSYTQLHPQVSLDEIASLLSHEDTNGSFRKALVVNSSSYLTEQLADNSIERIVANTTTQTSLVAFMFPGIGDHYVQMGRDLYTAVPYFREIVDECDLALRPYLAESLTDILYPPETSPQTKNEGLDLAAMLGRKPESAPASQSPEARLQDTSIAHPLVFSIEYALARLLMHWGMQPDALLGYSLGEYVAATLAGVIALEDALALVAQRAALIQALPAGKMLAVPLGKADVMPYLNAQISLSAHNSDSLTVLAGETEAILSLQSQLLQEQIACRVLDTTHAFHSHMMQDAVAEVTRLARSFNYAYPEIPYLSNVTGTWITAKQATDPAYWAQHMCQPVQCFTMLSQLLSHNQVYHLIEVGPGQSLGSFVKQHPQCRREQYPFIYPTLRYSYDHHDDHWFLLSTIRKLWLTGVDLQWEALSPGYSDALTQERPFTFSSTNTPSTTLQKDRGEKRRQNQLRRRRSDSNRRISS